MDELKDQIVKASLLHDIGKVFYRADPGLHRDFRHQESGALWARKAGFPEPVTTAVLRHHRLRRDDSKYDALSADTARGDAWTRNLVALVCEADNIAAGMERKDSAGDEGRFELAAPLSNIFSTVDIGKGRPTRESCFPVDPGSFPVSGPAPGGLKRVWEAMEGLFKPELTEGSLLYVLRRHLINVPEYTWVSESWPSTYLYHHMKTTAAVALANYLYLRDEKGRDFQKDDLTKEIAPASEERFLLVAGDLSGIQDFIYTVSSKRALRLLRARSFYLELLVETAVALLLEEGSLARCSVVYRSGGGFYVLGPNTEGFRSALGRLEERLNTWLYRQFGLKLYLAMASVPVSASDLRKDAAPAWAEAHGALAAKKNRKWSGMLAEVFRPRPPADKECEACRAECPEEDIEERDELEVCPFCRRMLDLGARLPEIDVLGQISGASRALVEVAGVGYSDRGPFVRQYVLKEPARVDLKSADTWDLLTGAFVSHPEFEELARRSTGAPRLGVLRMDVDNLGLIFKKGLKDRTLARMSDLSERLDLFFKYHLPKRLPEFSRNGLFGERETALALVYSGGDDLFLVGAWDQALDAAFAIERLFREYTGDNPNVTLSGGLVVVNRRLALHKSGRMAGAEEERAKRSGRNRLAVFSRAFSWDRSEEIADIVGSVVAGNEKGGVSLSISKGLLHFLLSEFRKPEGWRLPRMYYALRRANKPGLLRVLIPRIDSELVPVALSIADLATRGGETG